MFESLVEILFNKYKSTVTVFIRLLIKVYLGLEKKIHVLYLLITYKINNLVLIYIRSTSYLFVTIRSITNSQLSSDLTKNSPTGVFQLLILNKIVDFLHLQGHANYIIYMMTVIFILIIINTIPYRKDQANEPNKVKDARRARAAYKKKKSAFFDKISEERKKVTISDQEMDQRFDNEVGKNPGFIKEEKISIFL